MHLVLTRGWPADRLIEIRRVAADAYDGWPWLTPPASMGPVTAVDVSNARADQVPDRVREWVVGARAAWAAYDREIEALTRRLFG